MADNSTPDQPLQPLGQAPPTRLPQLQNMTHQGYSTNPSTIKSRRRKLGLKGAKKHEDAARTADYKAMIYARNIIQKKPEFLAASGQEQTQMLEAVMRETMEKRFVFLTYIFITHSISHLIRDDILAKPHRIYDLVHSPLANIIPLALPKVKIPSPRWPLGTPDNVHMLASLVHRPAFLSQTSSSAMATFLLRPLAPLRDSLAEPLPVIIFPTAI